MSSFLQSVFKIFIVCVVFYCLDHFLSVMLNIPFELCIPDNYDPSNYLQVTILRCIEIFILILLYKKELGSMAGLTDYFKNIIEISLGFFISFVGLLFVFIIHIVGFIDLSNLFSTQNHLDKSLYNLSLFMIAGGLIGPFAEELFFRAYLIHLSPQGNNLTKKTPLLILIGIIFVLPHVDFSQLETGLMQHLINLDINGSFSAISTIFKLQWMNIFMWSTCALITLPLFLWRRSILAGWVIHCMANITLYLLQNGFISG
jgi:membrane protease YdiL (CAAX protease family)